MTVKCSLPSHFDDQRFRQCVHHRNPDTVEATGRFVSLVRKLSAGVERRKDDFEGGLVLEFRVGVDRDTPPVVDNGYKAVCVQPDINPIGPPADGLVHRVVEDFRKQVVHRAVVRTADIHARSATHSFQALKDLDVLCVIPATGGGR